MTDLTTIPMEDDFETTLSTSWNGATGTVNVNDTPDGTIPANNYSYIVVNPGESNMQVAKIDGRVADTSFNVSSIDVPKGQGGNYSAVNHAAGATVRFSNNYAFWKDIQTAINSKADTTALNAKVGDFVFSGSTATTPAPMTFSDSETAPVTLKTLATGAPADQYVAVSENDTTVGHLEDKLTAGSGITLTKNNPGESETMTIAVDTDTIATKTYVETEINTEISNIEHVLTNSDFMTGEDLVEGDNIFQEEPITFADADQSQNVGDVAGNTRVSARAIGSGVAGNTLKLSLAKVVSPSVDLGIRIETDNAGEPSGTLVDANATATIAPGDLTTSLADTTVTIGGSITIPKGDVCHIVVFQGTYGSETVNASNYYKIGYGTDNTTTRGLKLWNGALRGSEINAINDCPTLVSSDTDSQVAGYSVTAGSDVEITAVNKDASSGATRALLRNSSGTTLATASFVGNVATFSANNTFSNGETFQVVVDNGGGNYNHRYANGITYPISGANLTLNNLIIGTGTNTTQAYDIDSIVAKLEVDNFIYTSSDLFATTLYSKTDARYTYKLPDIPRIVDKAYSAGEIPKYDFLGISKHLTGLTKGSVYKLSDTPGALTTGSATNTKDVAKAIDTNALYIYDVLSPNL